MSKFKIPVEWTVCDFVEVEAETFKDAIRYVVENRDEIPLGAEPKYIDGTYKINSEDDVSTSEYDGEEHIEALEEVLISYGYGSTID